MAHAMQPQHQQPPHQQPPHQQPPPSSPATVVAPVILTDSDISQIALTGRTGRTPKSERRSPTSSRGSPSPPQARSTLFNHGELLLGHSANVHTSVGAGSTTSVALSDSVVGIDADLLLSGGVDSLSSKDLLQRLATERRRRQQQESFIEDKILERLQRLESENSDFRRTREGLQALLNLEKETNRNLKAIASNLERECGKQKSTIRQLSARVESLAKHEAAAKEQKSASEAMAIKLGESRKQLTEARFEIAYLRGERLDDCNDTKLEELDEILRVARRRLDDHRHVHIRVYSHKRPGKKGKKPIVIYVVEVSNGAARYSVFKAYRDFLQFHKELRTLPDVKLDNLPRIPGSFGRNQGKQNVVENRTKALHILMSYVYNIPALFDCDVVRRFLTPSPSQQKANPTSNAMAEALFAQNADFLSSQGQGGHAPRHPTTSSHRGQSALAAQFGVLGLHQQIERTLARSDSVDVTSSGANSDDDRNERSAPPMSATIPTTVDECDHFDHRQQDKLSDDPNESSLPPMSATITTTVGSSTSAMTPMSSMSQMASSLTPNSKSLSPSPATKSLHSRMTRPQNPFDAPRYASSRGSGRGRGGSGAGGSVGSQRLALPPEFDSDNESMSRFSAVPDDEFVEAKSLEHFYGVSSSEVALHGGVLHSPSSGIGTGIPGHGVLHSPSVGVGIHHSPTHTNGHFNFPNTRGGHGYIERTAIAVSSSQQQQKQRKQLHGVQRDANHSAPPAHTHQRIDPRRPVSPKRVHRQASVDVARLQNNTSAHPPSRLLASQQSDATVDPHPKPPMGAASSADDQPAELRRRRSSSLDSSLAKVGVSQAAAAAPAKTAAEGATTKLLASRSVDLTHTAAGAGGKRRFRLFGGSRKHSEQGYDSDFSSPKRTRSHTEVGSSMSKPSSASDRRLSADSLFPPSARMTHMDVVAEDQLAHGSQPPAPASSPSAPPAPAGVNVAAKASVAATVADEQRVSTSSTESTSSKDASGGRRKGRKSKKRSKSDKRRTTGERAQRNGSRNNSSDLSTDTGSDADSRGSSAASEQLVSHQSRSQNIKKAPALAGAAPSDSSSLAKSEVSSTLASSTSSDVTNTGTSDKTDSGTSTSTSGAKEKEKENDPPSPLHQTERKSIFSVFRRSKTSAAADGGAPSGSGGATKKRGGGKSGSGDVSSSSSGSGSGGGGGVLTLGRSAVRRKKNQAPPLHLQFPIRFLWRPLRSPTFRAVEVSVGSLTEIVCLAKPYRLMKLSVSTADGRPLTIARARSPRNLASPDAHSNLPPMHELCDLIFPPAPPSSSSQQQPTSHSSDSLPPSAASTPGSTPPGSPDEYSPSKTLVLLSQGSSSHRDLQQHYRNLQLEKKHEEQQQGSSSHRDLQQHYRNLQLEKKHEEQQQGSSSHRDLQQHCRNLQFEKKLEEQQQGSSSHRDLQQHYRNLQLEKKHEEQQQAQHATKRKSHATWHELDGEWSKASIGKDGTLWALDVQGAAFRREFSSWQQMSGSWAHIDVGSSSHVVAVQSSGDVFRFSSAQQTWVQCKKAVPQGGAWKAAIGEDGELWAISKAHQLFRCTPKGAWKPVAFDAQGGSKPAQICVANAKYIYARSDRGRVFFWNGRSWIPTHCLSHKKAYEAKLTEATPSHDIPAPHARAKSSPNLHLPPPSDSSEPSASNGNRLRKPTARHTSSGFFAVSPDGVTVSLSRSAAKNYVLVHVPKTSVDSNATP